MKNIHPSFTPGTRGLIENLSPTELVELLLDETWHRRCRIIPAYMPPYPKADTKPTVQVCFDDGTEYPPFLRYSHGPKQGYFWDVHGDDMGSVTLAVLALSQAPAPVSVGPVTYRFKLNKEK
jgi:hypothetical protein